MNTQIAPRFTSQELNSLIIRHIKEIADAADAAKVSAEMLRYLETTARFHKYSMQNIWLILMACPNATRVAGFNQWKTMNRFVRKGERGIPILAPIFTVIKKNDETENPQEQPAKENQEPRRFLSGFKVVYVFDISQTEGEPLPDLSWHNDEKLTNIHERVIAFAQDMGIKVTVKELPGSAMGVSRGGSIEISPYAGTATLVHEVAHELLHHKDEGEVLTREEEEIEAEAIAYVVSKYFGLKDKDPSANYLAMWSGSKESILAHLERIHKTAVMIIEGLEVYESGTN